MRIKTMKVKIVSLFAMADDRDDWTWEGEIEVKEHDDPVDTCEEIYRFFNRVDEADGDRLQGLGYRLPSLSVGDLIEFGQGVYRVNGVGFEKVVPGL